MDLVRARRVGAALTLVLALACAWPAGLVLAEEPAPVLPTSRLGSPEVFGYLTHWDLDAQIDYRAITTIAYFSLAAGADGKLVRRNANGSVTTEYSRWRSSKVAGIIEQAHAQGVKFVLTVERMAWSDEDKTTTRALLASPAARSQLVTEIVNEVVARGLDGVSLDFEPVLSDTRDHFATLLAELRAAFDALNPGYQITFAATGSAPTLTYQMYGAVTAAGWADAVLIMAYPLRSLDANIAGGLAPLYSATSYDLVQIANAYMKYVAANKVVMLLPWYGRQWPTETDQLNARVQSDRTLYDRPRNLGYSSALSYAMRYGRRLDPLEMSAWTAFRWRYCSTCPETWKQIYYDDVETLGYKYDWTIAKGMAGVGIWALGYDNDRPELWQLLRTRFDGLIDTDGPSGSITTLADEGTCDQPAVRLAVPAEDGPDGSGVAYVRIAGSPDLDADGSLLRGTTYPWTGEISWPIDPPASAAEPAPTPAVVYAQWRDVAGNWSDLQAAPLGVAGPATASVQVLPERDTVTTPTVEIEVRHTGGRPISRVLLSNSDALVDGMLAYAVEAVVGATAPLSLVDPAVGGTNVDGLHTFYAQWQDSVGCWSAPVSASVVLDREGPVGTLSLADAPDLLIAPYVELLAPAADAISQVARVELSNDGAAWIPFPPTDEPISWAAGDVPDGRWTISARWVDSVGNVSAPTSLSVTLDRQGPAGALSINGGATATASETVVLDAPATDEASSISVLRVSNSPTASGGVLVDGTDFAPGEPVTWALAGAGSPGGVADGIHTVFAQWQDAAGHWSDVISDSILVDRTAPHVTSPTTRLRSGAQLGTGKVPVDVSWVASDAGSGVAGVSVESTRDGAAWTALPDKNVVAPGEFMFDPGWAWRVRVSAVDALGNASDPSAGDPFSVALIEDSSAALSYAGGWTRALRETASGGSVRFSKTRGATVTLRFTGRAFAWVAPTGPGLGKARVLINGRAVTTIDLQGIEQQRTLVFARNWSRSRTRTITVKVLGTSGRPRIEVDAFVAVT